MNKIETDKVFVKRGREDPDVNMAQKNAQVVKNEGDLFRFQNGKLIKVELLDQVHKEKTINTYLKELSSLQDKFEIHRKVLRSFLDSCGIDLKDNELESLNDLLVIKPHEKYIVCTLNSEQYITNYKELEGEIIEVNDIPRNTTNGCYYIKDNKITLDKNKLERKMLL